MSGTVLSEGHLVAHKEHVCWLCSRTIEPGETYHHAVWLDYDHGFMSLKQCAHCEALVRDYGDDFIWDWHEGYSADDVREWDPETPGGVTARTAFLAGWRVDGVLLQAPVRMRTPPEWPKGTVLRD